jgi:hypothetical protein
MSPEQVEFQNWADDNQFPHFVVKSFSAFESILKDFISGKRTATATGMVRELPRV